MPVLPKITAPSMTCFQNMVIFFSNFHIPKCLAGFEKQSILVGMAIMYHQFAYKYMVCGEQMEGPKTHCSKDDTLELYVHKDLVLLNSTHLMAESHPNISRTHVSSVESKVKVVLKRTSVTGKRNNGPSKYCGRSISRSHQLLQ